MTPSQAPPKVVLEKEKWGRKLSAKKKKEKKPPPSSRLRERKRDADLRASLRGPPVDKMCCQTICKEKKKGGEIRDSKRKKGRGATKKNL